MTQYKPRKHELKKIENTFCMRCKHQSCLMLCGGCPALISLSESKTNQNTEEEQHEKVQ